MKTCAWKDDNGRWHRSLLHVWKRRNRIQKDCVRCGKAKVKW